MPSSILNEYLDKVNFSKLGETLKFLEPFSIKLYVEYCTAEKFWYEIPEYTLVKLRAYATQFVDEIYKSLGININSNSKNLYEKINSEIFKSFVPFEIREKLNNLRLEGNKGAHPEIFQREHDLTSESARMCLKDAYEIAVWIYKEIYKGTSDKINPFILPEKTNIDKICSDAILKNDPESQYRVGLMLESRADKYVENEMKSKVQSFEIPIWEYADAVYWYRRARLRSPSAMYHLGILCLEGCGTEKNEQEGANYIEIASSYEQPDAQYKLGFFYLEGLYGYNKDFCKAFELFNKSAEQENLEALTTLIKMYRDGIGISKDTTKAFECAYKAAQAGYPSAQYNLGYLYENAIGVEKSIIKALEWYKKAATLENPNAQVALFRLHSQGILLDINLAEALKYLNLAAEQNLPEALYYLGLAYKNANGVSRDYFKAFSCFCACFRYGQENDKFCKLAKEQFPDITNLLRKELSNPNLTEEMKKEIMFNIMAALDKDGYPYKNEKEGIEKLLKESQEFFEFIEKNPGSYEAKQFNEFRENGTGIYTTKIKQSLFLKQGKIGRNQLCTCGSGKKYKYCCFKNKQ